MTESRSADPFAEVRKATDQHRARHRLRRLSLRHGPLLGVLAAAVQARRILELGTALGYTALSFAHGAPNSMVDTIERDPQHVQLARAEYCRRRPRSSHRRARGRFRGGAADARSRLRRRFLRRSHAGAGAAHRAAQAVADRRLLITANLNHGGTADAVAKALFDGKSWRSALVDDDGETAISVKL